MPSAEYRHLSEEQINRNWNELLQELRVTQTGVQILSGFLLTVPFSQRFASLDQLQRDAYLAVLCCSVLATGLIVAPVAFHRLLFRHRMRPWLVEAANTCAKAGLAMLALSTCGGLFLVFDVVIGRTAGFIALGLALLFFAAFWGGVAAVVFARRHDLR
jgi:hypothetical protein